MFLLIFDFSMTNDTKIDEATFTLVTSQRKNRRKQPNKRFASIEPLKPAVDDIVDEKAVIK